MAILAYNNTTGNQYLDNNNNIAWKTILLFLRYLFSLLKYEFLGLKTCVDKNDSIVKTLILSIKQAGSICMLRFSLQFFLLLYCYILQSFYCFFKLGLSKKEIHCGIAMGGVLMGKVAYKHPMACKNHLVWKEGRYIYVRYELP